MAPNFYVTGAEYGSGKSVIVLAIMELLSGRSDKVGIFRPVVRTAPEQAAPRMTTQTFAATAFFRLSRERG